MKAKERILYPTDFSPAAKPAFEYALETAQHDDAVLILAHVIEPDSPYADDLALALKGPGRDAVEAAVRRQFDGLLGRAKAADVQACDLLRYGRPAEEIVNAAVAEFADLIVMGTNGRKGLRRLMLGSVAQQVVATAPCPVVTVRMKDPLT